MRPNFKTRITSSQINHDLLLFFFSSSSSSSSSFFFLQNLLHPFLFRVLPSFRAVERVYLVLPSFIGSDGNHFT